MTTNDTILIANAQVTARSPDTTEQERNALRYHADRLARCAAADRAGHRSALRKVLAAIYA